MNNNMNNYNNGFNTNSNYPNNQYSGGNVYNNYNQQVPSPQAQEQMSNQSSLAAGGNLYDFSQDLPQTSSNGYSNENTVYKSSKKKGGGFFAFLEFLIIVFLCLYIANDKGYIHIEFLDNLIPTKEVEEPKKEEKEEKEPTPEESVVTESKINIEYTNKAYYISNIGVNFNNVISPIFTKETKIGDLSDTDKLKAIITGLHTVDKAYKNIESEEEFKAVFPGKDISKKDKVTYVEASIVEEKYKAIFGEGLTNSSIDSTCPVFVYNDTYKKYYLDSDCMIQSNKLSMDYFVYKITSIDDYYHVYMTIDTYKENEDGTVSIYKDVEQKNLYKTISTTDFSNFKLSVDNYKEFDRYKVSFKKNGDTYLFDSIVKVENTDQA